MMKPAPDIRYLFEPRSVAVVGASPAKEKIGYRILENIVSGGYKGKIYPVNPKGGEILGMKVHTSVAAIGEKVDMATIVIPANLVAESIKDCAAAGVSFASIITSGFSEVGNTEEEHRIVAMAREAGIRILGPNIFGIYSAESALNATFSSGNIRRGNVAIITQSGALGIAMIGKTAAENIGLSAIVSVGNKADIDEGDLLDYLVAQEDTKVILMYIEGIRGGERFVDALRRAARLKPLVAIKSGRSRRGAIAAASHTGSLAGADGVLNDVLRQCGILRAENIREAFDWCQFIGVSPASRGPNSVIITNGGGIGVMATDACEKFGVGMLDDAVALKEVFGPVVPSFGSTKNPVDMTGGAKAADYDSALEAGLEDPAIDSVIALYCETAVFDSESLEKTVEENWNKYKTAGKPVVFSLFGGTNTEEVVASLRHKNVPVYADVYEAVSCLGALITSSNSAKRNAGSLSDQPVVDLEAIRKIAANALADGRTFLLAGEGRQVMEAAGIPVPGSAICRNIGEVVAAAERIGYPLVMKVVSRDILHKSDMGGVALDLDDRNEVMQAYEAIMHNCRTRAPGAKIEGVEVAEMVNRTTEMIIGARHDPSLGPTVMCGMGGIYVEVLKDVSFRALPLDRAEAVSMIKQTKAYQLLLGVRGEERRDLEAVIDTILKLGAILQGCGLITDIEVNPVVVNEAGKGVKALDARILISDKGGA
jgi:acetyltransferase